VQLRFQGGSGGYGYNYKHLTGTTWPAPGYTPVWRPVTIVQVASTSQTVCFVDAVAVDWWSQPNPVLIEAPLAEPPSGLYPSCHFRFLGRVCNVLFADGHVEAWTDPTRNATAPWVPGAVLTLMNAENVFDIGRTDELWDRN
jgi:prepilin-type processing-associated H-X9-DG protein